MDPRLKEHFKQMRKKLKQELFFFIFQAELADALRKRKSRSDASDEDLGLPRSPATPPRNGSYHVVDGQINSTNIVGRHQHHSSLGLLSMASSESMEPSNFLPNSKSSNEIGKVSASDEIFPPEISLHSRRDADTRLSHSAAKHKMAIRPKKKGPSRPPRKSNNVSYCEICIKTRILHINTFFNQFRHRTLYPQCQKSMKISQNHQPMNHMVIYFLKPFYYSNHSNDLTVFFIVIFSRCFRSEQVTVVAAWSDQHNNQQNK